MEVIKVGPSAWKEMSEDAHKTCFEEIKPSYYDRIDFALIAGKDNVPCGYVTCRELDHETVYWQFGGSFPGTKGTTRSWACYQALTSWCKENGFKRITTLIENTNTTMLKFAMKMGYLIHGVRVYKGSILVEHILELGD